jgi:hypothetical protein
MHVSDVLAQLQTFMTERYDIQRELGNKRLRQSREA